MSTAIEITVTNNATVDVAPAVASASASALKKSFPAKYLKVLSIGLYVLKKMHPDVYVDKFVEHMKMGDSIESIMSEIDEHVFAAASNLENEVRQIKRDLGKKPKKAKKSRVAKVAESAKGTTEQIVELANEPTIVRGGDEPIIPQEPTVLTKTKKSKKAAPVITAPVVTETVTEPVVVAETPAPVTDTPVVVETPAPKAKVTKAKVPKVSKDAAAVVASEPVKVKEELDVGEPKVTDLSKESKVAKVAKKPKAPKVAAPVPSEYTPSDELVEESEKE